MIGHKRGRKWLRKYRVKCPACDWRGVRGLLAKKCPRCGYYHPQKLA
jgi:phage FluMu protein Com